MDSKKLTIQVIPGNTGKIRTWTLSSSTVKVFYVFLFLLLMIGVGLFLFSGKIALQLTTTEYLKKGNDRLFIENQQLRSALTDLDSLRVLHQKFGNLAQTYLNEGLKVPAQISLPEKPPLASNEQVENYLDKVGERLKNTKKSNARPSIKPVIGIISQKYSQIDNTGKEHGGIDIAAMINDPVYVTAPGVVTYSGWKSDYGITVIVDHGDSYKTLYAHLNRNVVKKGDFVERGQTIGMVGMTGNTSGPHLHYEIKYNQKTVNPEDYFLKSL